MKFWNIKCCISDALLSYISVTYITSLWRWLKIFQNMCLLTSPCFPQVLEAVTHTPITSWIVSLWSFLALASKCIYSQLLVMATQHARNKLDIDLIYSVIKNRNVEANVFPMLVNHIQEGGAKEGAGLQVLRVISPKQWRVCKRGC